jgi:hypothetical protein
MFKDVFMHLSNKLCDLMKGRALLGSVLASIVREEFESSRDKLVAHDYPNTESKKRTMFMLNGLRGDQGVRMHKFVAGKKKGE